MAFEQGFGLSRKPHNLEAEMSVLGAILLDSAVMPAALEKKLVPDCFYKEEHKKIFDVLQSMYGGGEAQDFITVLERVKRAGIFDTDEQAKIYLTQLCEVVPTAVNIDAYADIVLEKYYLRRLVRVAENVLDNTADSGGEAALLLDKAEQDIYEIRQGRDEKGIEKISRVITEVFDRLQLLANSDESVAGIPTGYGDLDRLMLGLNRSDLILLAARPGMGKTSFALNIASNVAGRHKGAVVVFSLEMTKEQLAMRLLSQQSGVDNRKLRVGGLSDDEWVRLGEGAGLLTLGDNFYLDDTSAITVPEMKAKLRRIPDLDLVIIDYLQLMQGARQTDNRVQEISAITRSLKLMAKDLGVPVLTLSQLSRSIEKRSDHRPLLSDLRESGSIEQDADIVLFLSRELYPEDEGDDAGSLTECYIAKNRHGETGKIYLSFDGRHTKFFSVERTVYDER